MLHRVGGRAAGSLDDLVFFSGALLDAWELTQQQEYHHKAEHLMRIAIERFGDPEAGGFFDRAKDAAPMGGLEVRRKPIQDSPTPAANSVAAIVLDRLYGSTGEKLYRDWAEKTLEAFAGLVPQFGLFAATYGLAALLHERHPANRPAQSAILTPQHSSEPQPKSIASANPCCASRRKESPPSNRCPQPCATRSRTSTPQSRKPSSASKPRATRRVKIRQTQILAPGCRRHLSKHQSLTVASGFCSAGLQTSRGSFGCC